jgi:FYVE zinc finger
MSASSVTDSTSSGSDSDLESPPLPASAQQPSSGLHRDSLPPRFTSRQSSASGSRSAGYGISPNFPHEQSSTSANPPGLFTPSMTPEARRQSMIAMDRKRRLTGSVSTYEPARRRYTPTEFLTRTRSNEQDPQPSQYTQRPVHQDHTSENTSDSPHREVIDLTGSSPPLPPPHSPPRHNQPSRTSSSSSRRYAVPAWQPDSEVSHCPICKKQFKWMFRRHHCRKCGRVVCDSCSPHRITIPRQYIVNPPRPESSSVTAPSGNETIDLTVEDEGEEVTRTRRRSRHASIHTVEGGEKVRLCNPCVPDPQPEPPPYFTPFPQDVNPQVLQSGLQDQSATPSHTNIFGQPRRGANVCTFPRFFIP